MSNIERIRNIGISAHIDSGKTTLTERILYFTGKIHAIHEVRGKDGVGAKMDSMDLEREKGITIQSAATYCEWKDVEINIIDTPGHVDFTIEVERALRVLDGAVLVLCSVAGVQSQSITVDRQMKRYHVPRIAFINKCDRTGANPDRVIEQLREKLNHNAWALQLPIGLEGDHRGVVDCVDMKAYFFEGEGGDELRVGDIPEDLKEAAEERHHELIAALADLDETIGDKFLMEEEVTSEELGAAIRKATIDMNFTPVMMGSAFKNKGVQPLLDAVASYLPTPTDIVNEALDQKKDEEKVPVSNDVNDHFLGLAFKLEDGRYGQLTYMRIYQGTVKKGEFIVNNANGRKSRVPRLVRMHADEMHDVSEAKAGDIIAMFGIDCASGDTFTDGKINYTMTSMHVPAAVIDLAIEPKDKGAQQNFSKALARFRKEDPTFRVALDKETSQTIISGMGELHLDIYIERMRREYDCEVIAGRPQVAYRETITQRADFNYTHKKQTGGSGQYAKIGGYFEPLPADAVETYEFIDEIVGGCVPREYIPAVDKGFKEACIKGPLIGFPVVGIRACLNDGSSHAVDSSEMAFKIAAVAAFKETMQAGRPAILEPVMKVEVSAPEEFQGQVIGQLNQRRGVIQSTEVADNYVTAIAEIPLNQMFGYSTDIRSATQGKGEFTMEFSRYLPVPRAEKEALIEEYRKEQEAKNKKK